MDKFAKNNLIPIKQIDLSYPTREAINKLKDMTHKDILLFRTDCCTILQKITSTILEKSGQG